MKKSLLGVLLVFSFQLCYASFTDSLPAGTWKGTSICQVKSSPCHDEIAAYHISNGDKPGRYHMIANKVVNGVEEDMGELDFTYDAATHTLTNVDMGRGDVWKFKITGNKMDGTLFYKDQLYRIIKLTKEK